MHRKFEINRTKIKGGCQSRTKVVTHDSKCDLPLVVVVTVTAMKANKSVLDVISEAWALRCQIIAALTLSPCSQVFREHILLHIITLHSEASFALNGLHLWTLIAYRTTHWDRRLPIRPQTRCVPIFKRFFRHG